MEVVEFQAAAGRAAAAGGADIGAASTVSHPGRAHEPRRQVARVRVASLARSRAGRRRELLSRQIFEQDLERAVEDLGDVAARYGVPEQVLCRLQPVPRGRTDREPHAELILADRL